MHLLSESSHDLWYVSSCLAFRGNLSLSLLIFLPLSFLVPSSYLLHECQYNVHTGDERPCQRCIKRGLANLCQDGVRKQAKHLHDAAPEALRPALDPNYNQVSNARPSMGNNNGLPTPNAAPEQNPTPQHPRLSYGSLKPTFSRQPAIQQLPASQVSKDAQNSFEWVLFDPSNPALFNFDLESLNFGDHYDALEFRMLSRMSSGAAETFSKGSSTSTFSQDMGDVSFSNVAPQNMLQDFEEIDRQHNADNIHQGLPHAYTGLPSHHNSNTEALSDCTPRTPPHQSPKWQETQPDTGQKFGLVSVLGKHTQDSSSVHEPYSSTTGFHTLTAVLHRRFSADEAFHITKSLASVNRQEMILMEKYLQGILLEYEELLLNCCTPTLVCRRTGEVVAVNKEFTILTGWTRDVLLGKKANLNANIVTPESLENTHGGFAMPKTRPLDLSDQQGKEDRPQPVFLAELLDNDSAITFYEDFSRLAFRDSRGSVKLRGKLLKYQREEGMDMEIDCNFCWTTKKDVFDIPILIIMNVSLPCPHLLLNEMLICQCIVLTLHLKLRERLDLYNNGEICT